MRIKFKSYGFILRLLGSENERSKREKNDFLDLKNYQVHSEI